MIGAVPARRRLLGLLLRQQSPLRRAAVWALGVAGPLLLALALVPVRARLGLAGYLFCALLVVIAVALMGGLRQALAAVVVGFLAGAFFFAAPYNSLRVYLRLDNVPLIGFLVVGATIGILVQALTELADEQAASRLRVVAAADEARRQIERDLHDGAQQRLVTLGLELRAAQRTVPAGLSDLGGELERVADGLASVMEELREMARGIHPAVLAQGGLGPALRSLARRSAIPVEIEVAASARMPDAVEVAAYYVVSETLTNAAKHAQASVARVNVEARIGALVIEVRDDGRGGADAGRGSGLVGLRDRVEALGGSIAVHSPPGAGTSVRVDLPLEH
jgi:signal transduction histidine kinase